MLLDHANTSPAPNTMLQVTAMTECPKKAAYTDQLLESLICLSFDQLTRYRLPRVTS
jgi:hypothetical protein